MRCPVCEAQLKQTPYEGVPVHVCLECRGTLVEADRLHVIERRRQCRWSEAELREIASSVAADATARRRCPRCLMFMDRIDASWGMCTFHLDRCEPCKAVWLDAGELELVQAAYEKEVDGRTPEDWARIERLAVADLKLKERLRTEDEEEGREIAEGALGANAFLEGPLAFAAFIARQAHRNIQDGLDEPSPPERQRLFFKAGIFILVGLLVYLLWYFFWPRWR